MAETEAADRRGERDAAVQGAITESRALIRGATSASLGTATEGQPFVSLVTPAAAPDLTLLMWLSSLSEHTRHLATEPRCSLLFAGTAESANPQTAPRITVTGLAERVAEGEVPPLKARWLGKHPYAAIYADFADFSLWRVRIAGALYVGGFARALRLKGGQLAPDPAAAAAVAAIEAGAIAHMNEDHAEACALIAERLCGGAPGPWKIYALDTEGCELTDGNSSVRFGFPEPVEGAEGLHRALVAAAKAARAKG